MNRNKYLNPKTGPSQNDLQIQIEKNILHKLFFGTVKTEKNRLTIVISNFGRDLQTFRTLKKSKGTPVGRHKLSRLNKNNKCRVGKVGGAQTFYS